MTPDVWTILEVVNAGAQDLLIGQHQDGQKGFNNQYQMEEWFDGLSRGKVLAFAKGVSDSNQTKIQFLRGDGDEDDGADSVWVLQDDEETNCIWYQARSDSNSGHYVGFEILNLPGLYIVSSDANGGPWTDISAETMDWYNGFDSNYFIPKDGTYLKNNHGYFIIADLSEIFESADEAKEIYEHIKKHTVSTEDKTNIYTALKKYVLG